MSEREISLSNDPVRLLLRLNSGLSIEQRDLDAIVKVIEEDLSEPGKKYSPDDVYSLILILGRTRKTEFSHLIERYLDSDDPFTVCLALEILCVDWQKTADYCERLISFALGVGWDEENDIRLCAMKIIGEYLHNSLTTKEGKKFRLLSLPKAEQRLVELLFALFGESGLETYVRQGAYYALCRAYGRAWEEIPSEFKTLDFAAGSPDIDWSLIDYFKRSLSELSASSSTDDTLSPATR